MNITIQLDTYEGFDFDLDVDVYEGSGAPDDPDDINDIRLLGMRINWPISIDIPMSKVSDEIKQQILEDCDSETIFQAIYDERDNREHDV